MESGKTMVPVVFDGTGGPTTELIWSIVNFWLHFKAFNVQPLAFSLLPVVYCIAIPIMLWFILKPYDFKSQR